MMITARCHPALEPLLPKPVPAARMLPSWLRDMPEEVQAASLGGAPVRTLKHCPPMIDAMRLGVLILCPIDLTVCGGELSWEWDPPVLPETLITRAPVGLHVPEQANGSPLAQDHIFIKFINYWTLEAEPGWSLLFHHPSGHPDLPFQTLSGVVDCDLFADGYVHFPAALEPGFEGVIPRGTPIAQVVPVQKDTSLTVTTMTEAEITSNRDVQEALSTAPGVYRKRFRR
ncbi:hypothetical protein [uncultured Roseobacter sp.]|uniref:hypothetical protein n=1 Tax=uncultured Roseobacter sp. TaxID=114847 RepID=UPI0026294951|nr:hypothetical protein [uncultured Roseobacter sp.]